MAAPLPNCASLSECLKHANTRVKIIGTYTVWDPLPARKKDHPPAQQVQIVFASGEPGPYLGTWGTCQHQRSLEEIKRFQGLQVAVIGRFLRSMAMPTEDSSRTTWLEGACLDPVDEIQLLEAQA
jgi:hypothetical protein